MTSHQHGARGVGITATQSLLQLDGLASEDRELVERHDVRARDCDSGGSGAQIARHWSPGSPVAATLVSVPRVRLCNIVAASCCRGSADLRQDDLPWPASIVRAKRSSTSAHPRMSGAFGWSRNKQRTDNSMPPILSGSLPSFAGTCPGPMPVTLTTGRRSQSCPTCRARSRGAVQKSAPVSTTKWRPRNPLRVRISIRIFRSTIGPDGDSAWGSEIQ